MGERLIQTFHERVQVFHEVLQEEKGLEGVLYLCEVLALFKQLAPVV